jgi:acyl-coenzyme A synthetase/AMP-(fatty) acid ligase
MLFSAESSLELVIAHVAALRAGIVVVPANTAYRARELAHIVNDARPRRRSSTIPIAPAGFARPRDPKRSSSARRSISPTMTPQCSMQWRLMTLR